MKSKVAVIVILVIAAAGAAIYMNKKHEQGADSGGIPATEGETTQAPKADSASSGLKIEEMVVGKGAVAEAGHSVTVHYTGWLTNGTKFDSSVDRKEKFTFPLGAGRVIKGWDQGVAGMKVGGKRKLTIPPEMAYGPMGAPPVIPPNSTLVFEVELFEVK